MDYKRGRKFDVEELRIGTKIVLFLTKKIRLHGLYISALLRKIGFSYHISVFISVSDTILDSNHQRNCERSSKGKRGKHLPFNDGLMPRLLISGFRETRSS